MYGILGAFVTTVALICVKESLAFRCDDGKVEKRLKCDSQDEWSISSIPANPTNVTFVLQAKRDEPCRGVFIPETDEDGAVEINIKFGSEVAPQDFEARVVCYTARGAKKVRVKFMKPGGAAPEEQEFEKNRFCLKGLRTMTSGVSIKFIELAPGSLSIFRTKVNACA